MFVLSRKQGESVMIGRDVQSIVVNKEDNRVKLGIEAPANITVRHTESLAAGSRQMLPLSRTLHPQASFLKNGTQS